MIQHVLLMMVGVPLVLLADPLPAVLWSVPAPARRPLSALLVGRAPLRRGWRTLTRLPIAWSLYAIVLWGWHLPAAYDAALAHAWLHDLEHLSFVLAAVLFWWPVIGPAPRPTPAPTAVGRVVYLLLAAFSSGALGVLLAAWPASLYAYPATSATPSPLEDQAWGGVIMWVVGGTIDMAAVLAVVARVMGGERRLVP
jgi:putative membrane protein